jgi:hypothetical protein
MRPASAALPALLALAGVTLVSLDCGSDPANATSVPASVHWSNASGSAQVDVTTSPFGLVIRDAKGRAVLESAPSKQASDAADPMRAYSPLALTHNTDMTVPVVMVGWDYYRGDDGPWSQASRVTKVEPSPEALVLTIATGIAAQPTVTLSLESQGLGVRLRAQVDAAAALAAERAPGVARRIHDLAPAGRAWHPGGARIVGRVGHRGVAAAARQAQSVSSNDASVPAGLSRPSVSWRIIRIDTISRWPLISGTRPRLGSIRMRSNWKLRPGGRLC